MATITTTQISNGDTLDATTVDNNFDTIVAEFNGNIDDANIKTSANINGTKLLDGSIIGTKLGTSAITLGYADNTASGDQSGITAVTDVTNCSIAVTVPSGGRRVCITANVVLGSTVSLDRAVIAIQEGASVLKYGTITLNGTSFQTLTFSHFLVPTAGSHTYKLTVQRASGTGTITVAGNTSAGYFSSIHVAAN